MTPTRLRHRHRTTVLLTILITCVVAVGAIGAAWAFGWKLAEPSTSAPTPAATNRPYTNSAELVAAIKAAGTTCAGFRPPQTKTAGRDNGMCTTSGGELIVTIYADPNGRLAEAQSLRAYGGLARYSMLVGPNWTIYGPDITVESLAGKLGGDLAISPR